MNTYDPCTDPGTLTFTFTYPKNPRLLLIHLTRPSYTEHPHLILHHVARYYGLPLADLLGKRRIRRFAWPRQIAQYLLRELTEFSLPEIARLFGCHYSGIIHSIHAVKDRLSSDHMHLNNLKPLRTMIQQSLTQYQNQTTTYSTSHLPRHLLPA